MDRKTIIKGLKVHVSDNVHCINCPFCSEVNCVDKLLEATIKELEKEQEHSTEKVCKTCEYYVTIHGYGQCYGQKNAPKVDANEVHDCWKEME